MSPINWKDCVALYEQYSLRSRFEWPLQESGGFNCSEEITISELWGVISWIWTWPGDWVLRADAMTRFFELDQGVTGHWVSTLLGWLIFVHVAWYLVIIFVNFRDVVLGQGRK